jgi:hypothetical protein
VLYRYYVIYVQEHAMPTRVVILNEAIHPNHPTNNWHLCFQWVRYMHDDGSVESGYRFIWRRSDGSLQAARGQARIPSLDDAETLMNIAREQGWGKNDGDE